MLKSLINYTSRLCVTLLLVSTVVAQEATRTPPPILKGGIVHQLRSLSDDAIDALKKAERSPQPTLRQAQSSAPTTSAKAYPQYSQQPTGRATLRRTNSSPWLERFTQEASNPPSSNSVPPQAARPQLSPVEMASRAEVLTTEQLRGMRTTTVQADTRGVALAPRNQTPAMLKPEFYGEVHVEDQLPKAVRLSIRDEDMTVKSELVLDAPQVSRIPLPGTTRSNAKSATSTSSQPNRSSSLPEVSAGNSTKADLSKAESSVTSQRTPAQGPNQATNQAMQSSIPAREQPAPQADERGAAVNVPTRMVATPSAERRPLPDLPVLPFLLPVESKQAEAAGRKLNDTTEFLPSFPSQTSPTETADYPKPSMPVPALPTNPSTSTPNEVTSPNQVANPSQFGNAASSKLAPSRTSPSNTAPRRTSQAEDLERMKMETPRIEVVLNGPADMAVGTPAIYEVRVTNRDNIDLAGLILRFDVPAGVTANSKKPSRGEVEVGQAGDGATLFTWAFQNLAAGQSASVPIEILASSPRNFGVALEWTLMPLNAEAQIAVQSPQLEMLLEGPSEVNYGDANTYRLHVRNVGNAAASHVAVRMSAGPYGASETDIGSIAGGGEETIDVELTFNQKGSIGIEASAVAAGNLSCATAIDVLVKQSNLVAAIDAPSMIYHGRPAEYRIVISNTGDADARNVSAVCALPAGATLDKIPDGASLRDGRLSWPIENLRAGMAEEVLLQLNLVNDGENRIHLECSTVTGLATDCSASTQVESIVDLKLTVNDPVAPAPIGSDVLYELTLVNRGSKAGNNVRVVAQFSDGIEPIRGDGQPFRLVPGQLLFDPITRIEAGQSISLKVYARAESEGTHRFRAEVRSDDSELKLVQEESTRYLDTATRMASPTGKSILR